MANRDLRDYRSETQVIASKPVDYAGIAQDIGDKVIAQSQEAKINENISAAQLELGQLNNQYRMDNQGDPFGGLEKLKSDRDAIFNKYGEGISPYFKGEWQKSTQRLADHNDALNQAWGYKQSAINSKVSLGVSMKNNYDSANIAGQQFGAGTETEVGALLNYADSHNQLAEFGNKHLGEAPTATLMKDYNKDYMKSFISGVAETSPEKAAKLLDDPSVKDKFTTDERGEMIGVISKVKKQQELQDSLQQTVNTGQVSDIVNDDNKTYYQKRLEIDSLEFKGSIPNKIASQARRVLTSQKDIDAVTNTDTMSSIITKIYDVNTLKDTSSADYLKGVQNIHDDILDKQANGELSAPDAQKLNNQLKTLTSAKIADATQAVGNDFYDANEKFGALPPEFRGTATRELFYRTNGKDLTPEGYDRYANDVIQGINLDRRQKAIKNVKRSLEPDETFIKGLGYSMDDVNETAAKYNITPADVIKRLRAK